MRFFFVQEMPAVLVLRSWCVSITMSISIIRVLQGDDGLRGWGTITVPWTEYRIINDHHRYVRVTNKISDMVATRTFTVMYNIEVSTLSEATRSRVIGYRHRYIYKGLYISMVIDYRVADDRSQNGSQFTGP